MRFFRREALNGRTIDVEGANVETRDFRTCSQACLRDFRNPARPALELSFLPVKRKAKLKSAFWNCALFRKHPKGGKCKHVFAECVLHLKEGKRHKCRILGVERDVILCIQIFVDFQDKSKRSKKTLCLKKKLNVPVRI